MRRARMKNASRSRRMATAALTTLLICAVAAGAYWLLLPSGHGSSTPTAIGKAPAAAEYVLEPSFTAGSLKPGAGVPLTVKATIRPAQQATSRNSKPPSPLMLNTQREDAKPHGSA